MTRRPPANTTAPAALRAAHRLYRAFREAEPARIRRVDLAPPPRAMVHIGTVEFIGYMTTHGGKVVLYTHDFAPGSRPQLYTGSQRNQLAMVGGRYKVTYRGITDLDPRGRETDYSPRYTHKRRGF